MNTKKQNYALPVAMMFFLFFIIAFVTGLPSPMGVIVKEQFHLSNFQAQLGFLANFLAYAFMGIPSGILVQKIGYKKTALVALLLGILGVLVMFLGGKFTSFTIYISGAFIAGFTMCLLNTVVNPMLTVLGSEKGANQRLNFGGALNSSAATIVPMVGGWMMGSGASKTIENVNPLLFTAMAIFAVVFFVLLFVRIPEPEVAKNDNIVESIKHALSYKHFAFGVIAIFVYVGIEVGIPSMANLYMVDGLGYDPGIAGSLVGTYWLLMLVGRLVGGFLGKTFSSKQMMTFVSVLGLILVGVAILNPDITVKMVGIASNLSIQMVEVPIAIMFITLCGLCTSVMWPGIFNLATIGMGKYLGIASGIFMTMVMGGGILPAIQGQVADATSYLASYWVIMICLGFLLFYALIGSKVHKRADGQAV
ncbi:MAG: MFS transporter [Draconibacterium sp.]|nr:MFS transporter [Draconibacterium sp.]